MTEGERKQFEIYARLAVFRRRTQEAQDIITQALTLGTAYLACSWGKDSVVMLHLVQEIAPHLPVLHLRTPHQDLLDNYREVETAYRSRFPTQYEEIEIAAAQTIPMALKQLALWEQYNVAFIGVRAEENRRTRGISIARHGFIHQYQSGPHRNSYRVFPLGYWTWLDVWAYIVQHDLPYLRSYDHPAAGSKDRSRTTNVLPFSALSTSAKRYGRIAQIKALSPEAYRYLQSSHPQIAAFV